MHFKVLSAIGFNFDLSKNLSSGNGSREKPDTKGHGTPGNGVGIRTVSHQWDAGKNENSSSVPTKPMQASPVKRSPNLMAERSEDKEVRVIREW